MESLLRSNGLSLEGARKGDVEMSVTTLEIRRGDSMRDKKLQKAAAAAR